MAQLLYIGIIERPMPAFKRHQHDHWELVCYTHGCGVATVGGQDVAFAPGTIIAMPPDMAHQETADSARVGFTNLYIGVRGNLGFASAIPCCVDDAERTWWRTAETLRRERALKSVGHAAAERGLLELLLLWLQRWTGSQDDVVAQAQQAMQARLGDAGLRVEGIARELGLSDDSLRRRFVAVTGENPRAWLLQRRIEAATARLAQGERVGAVAAALGFTDAFYFSRVYRAHTGQAPSEARPRH